MPRRGGRHYVLVRGAEEAMRHFKMEVAHDLGLLPLNLTDATNTISDATIDDTLFKDLTTEQVGLIGGTMVRRIQAAGEWAILQRYKQGIRPLMPPDALPPNENIRSVTNNGNPARGTTVVDTPHTGQDVAQIAAQINSDDTLTPANPQLQ